MRTVVILGLLTAIGAWPQDRTSAISGVVTDESGAQVRGASIVALHEPTGKKSQAVTQSDGTYLLVKLELGNYTVTASQDGFRTGRHEAVLLELDRTAVANFKLTLGSRRETVVVTGEAWQIETTPSALTHLVDTRTIQQLPLNGRDYIQLATLQAGAPVARAQNKNVNQGYGIQISVSGSRPYQNSFRLDGLDMTYNGSSPGSTNGVSLGVDAVGEFSLLSSSYGAQYGQASGGVVNAVTKSGTNQFHGSGYYFHRNDNLDARNFFDLDRPEFRRHQFGGSLGGPVFRNKTFFFVNYEGLREARGNTTINTTLSPAAREGRLTAGTVAVDPKIRRILEFYPLPNSQILGDTGFYVFSNDTRSTENFVTARIDQTVGQSGRLFLRYSFNPGKRSNETDYEAAFGSNSTRQQSAVIEETHTLSPRLINTVRVGFIRNPVKENLTVAQNPTLDDPAFSFVPGGAPLGQIFVTGLTDFPGGSGSFASDTNVNRSYQVTNDLTYARGRHVLNAGVRLERTMLDTDSPSRQNGDYRFPSIARFLQNFPDRFRGQFPGSDSVRQLRQWLAALYFHDTVQLTSRITLDAGLRWELATIPDEREGKISNLLRVTDAEPVAGNPVFRKRALNFAPRVGIAWDVSGNGKTRVRAGYGIFPDFIRPIYVVFLSVRNPPYFFRGETRNLSPGDFPSGGYARLLATPTPDQAMHIMSPDLSQPYVQQWNLNVERSLGRTSFFRAAYVGSHGLNLSNIGSDANLVTPQILADGRMFFPANGQPVNPRFSQLWNHTYDAHSFYHGLQTEFRRRMTRNLQAQVTYTYSKSIDDSSMYFSSSEADNAAYTPVTGVPKFGRGLSGHDVRQYFTAIGSWETSNMFQRIPGRAFGGWQFAVIATASSGLPTSVLLSYDATRTGSHATSTIIGQRPDLAPNAPRNPVTGDPQRWIDPAAFRRPDPGFLGNLGRNTIIGANLMNVDFSTVRRFSVRNLGEAGTLDLRCEFFNIFNRANFDLPTAARMAVFSPTTTTEDFGRITSAAPSREIQVSMKLRF